MITQVVNKKKRDKLKKQPETNKPGTESYRKTREELTTYACYYQISANILKKVAIMMN